jgi:hypothetical protein
MRPVRLPAAALAVACLLFVVASARGDSGWLPVDAAALAAASPVVEPDADAEALLWDVRVEHRDGDGGAVSIVEHYLRVKVYTARGSESVGTVELPWSGGARISGVAGRTIRSDGSTVELAPDAVFERDTVAERRVTSFAMPAVEPGSVVEYRWTETRPLAPYTRLPLQRNIPVRRVTYRVKPLSDDVQTHTFHGRTTGFTAEKDGSFVTSAANVPAYREEPNMPPEDQVRPWILVYYPGDAARTAEAYWADFGKRLHETARLRMKVDEEVRAAAARIAGGAATPGEKLARLYDFCRTEIRNTSDDAVAMSPGERARLRASAGPSQTLARRQGAGVEINYLFGALCAASGLDARLARLPDRGEFFFDPSFADDYFLEGIDVAVRVGDEWRVFDPSSTYVPFGMLLWIEEGVPALVSDAQAPFWIRTPVSAPERSRERRTAALELSEDGTLEGDVRLEYTGHLAAARREAYDHESPERRAEMAREALRERLGPAEIRRVHVENATAHSGPLVVTARVRLRGYAQRTGKRLLLKPALFQQGERATFEAATRRYEVCFRYAWSESDEVTIAVPAGFLVESAGAPAPVDPAADGVYRAAVSVGPDGRSVRYTRGFEFGAGGRLVFPASEYGQLKSLFDTALERDGHTIALKRKGVE